MHANSMPRKREVLLIGALLLVVLVTACTPAATPTSAVSTAPGSPTVVSPVKPTQPASSAQSDIIVIVSDEPSSLCPLEEADASQTFFISPSTSWGLLEVDFNTGKLIPRLAERWEMVTTSQWRFYLRKDFKWQNGKPLTAQDIVWNINDQTDPDAHPAALTPRLQRSLKGKNMAKALDDYTVEINTPTPHPILANELVLLNLHEPESYKANPKACTEKPISNGPYMVVERKAGQYVRFEANPYFAGEPKPAFRSITMQFRRDATVRAAMVAKGEAAVAFNVGPGPATLAPKVSSQPATDVLMIRLDARFHPNYKDKRFRQALQYAINCPEIVKAIQGGFAECPVVPVPQSMVGVPADLKPYPYDPNKAKQLLKEAGMEGATITLYVRLIGRFPFESETYQAIVAYWTAIGLNVNLQVVEKAAYLEWTKKAGYKPEVTVAPESTLPTNSIPLSSEAMDIPTIFAAYGTCTGNRSLYCTSEMDALFKSALAASGAERTKLTEQLVRKWYDELPLLTLPTFDYVTAMRADIAYEATPNGEFRLNSIQMAK
jgi:peptide/nickel transport system substrate-binding protein